MAFIKYSDGQIKEVKSSPLSAEELADLEFRKQLEEKNDEIIETEKPKWATKSK